VNLSIGKRGEKVIEPWARRYVDLILLSFGTNRTKIQKRKKELAMRRHDLAPSTIKAEARRKSSRGRARAKIHQAFPGRNEQITR